MKKGTWAIIIAAVVSVATLALGWLQLQSAERAVGIQLPNTVFGGYDQTYIDVIAALMTDETMERYQSVHYFWYLIFPVAFAALIILLVRRFAGGSPLQWVFYLVAIAYAVVDISENFALEAAFSTNDGVSAAALASFLTTGKFILFGMAVLAFVLSFALNRASARRENFR